MKYKCSLFNLVLWENNEKVVIYNTFSGALSILSLQDYHMFQSGTIKDHALERTLVEQGYLVPIEMDEFQRFMIARQAFLFGESKQLGFVIAPTMACNLDCIYCFENSEYCGRRVKTGMTATVVSDTIRFITEQVDCHKGIDSLYIKWFGGEPLLELAIIRQMSTAFLELCKAREIDYSAFLITNGTLLSKETLDSLIRECGITKIQITLDGDESYFKLYKNATTGQYAQLIENLTYASHKLSVDVRMNVSRENQNEVLSIAKKLMCSSDISDALTIYSAPITGCDYDTCHSLTQQEFELFRRRFDQQVKPFNPSNGSIGILLARRVAGCGSMRKDFCAIGPDGYFYRCEHEIGKNAEVIGDVNHGFYRNWADLKLLNYKLEEQCKTCDVLPFCAGGCPIQPVIYGKHIDCDAMRSRVIDKLRQEVLVKYRANLIDSYEKA